jgi:glycosyltransferase involved in cell wall biosynthesis
MVEGPAVPPEPVGPAPAYRCRQGSLSHAARGFAEEPVACDVIMPFHGHLDYADQAVRSLLDQEGADLVIHLVDDGSREDTGRFLRFWGSHARIRTYRNRRNIGQFLSFNNAVHFRETELLAVQDADDVSLPRRIHWSGNCLRLADAEVFGGRVRLFREESDHPPARGNGRSSGRRWHGWWSSELPQYGQAHFMLNPTAVMRAEAFEILGGFADFGDVLRNRCGLDTEFYMRAFYSGRRFAVSTRVVLCYRCHADQATRNRLTGWGTPARAWSERENQRRLPLFQKGGFDARMFGALADHRAVTQRLNRGSQP